MIYLGLIAGFAILLVAGDLLVRGAVVLAIRLGVPALIIGLTVVAFGTSAPELVVSVRAALTGARGIAIGNVVGSNIANVLLVLGVPALISATDCDQPYIKRNLFYVIAASLIFIWLCFNGPLSVWHGAVLFTLIILFLIESGRRATGLSDNRDAGGQALEQIDGVSGLPTSNLMLVIFLVVGLIGLPLGAAMTVENGAAIARLFHVSEAAIGLTVVALGTSLPELATTLAAALRGHSGLALGNVLGSNIFNLLAIMGITALVAPIDVPASFLTTDLWIMLAASLILVPFVIARGRITRLPGIVFVCCYVTYIVLVFSPQLDVLAAQSG
jgi:cation:H+ antiporter